MVFDKLITLSTLFVAAPLTVMPLLDKSARLDLLDLHQAKLEAKAGNRFGGVTVMTELSDSLIALRLTESSTMELRLTPDSIIEVTHTVIAQHPNTTIRHFDLNWKEIPQKTKR